MPLWPTDNAWYTPILVIRINNDSITLFYITQSGAILFLLEHYRAFYSNVVEFSVYTGPGELILGSIAVLLFQAISPFQIDLSGDYRYLFSVIYNVCFAYSQGYLILGFVRRNGGFKKVLTFSKVPEHYGTEFGVSLCILLQSFNPALLSFNLIPEWNVVDILSHGLAMSMLTSDLIVAKMAKRELHPLIVLNTMLTVFNHNLLIFTTIGIYFLRIFYEICESMNIFLLSPIRNVYVSGVFDLCHFGHFNHFATARKFGNRLIVGVHSDEDVASYKRVPKLKMKERASAVGSCRSVDQVVKNAKLYITREFIEENNIHVVGCSQEYDSEDDEYYRVPREMGILQVIPRVEGISTSELIKRVKGE